MVGHPDVAAVDRLWKEISNWNKWGSDDVLGTINYITRQKVIEAAGLVRTGQVVSIAHDVITSRPDACVHPPTLHPVVTPAKLRVFSGSRAGVLHDELTIAVHGFLITHIDALSHVGFDGQIWQGRPTDDLVGEGGVMFGDVLAVSEGIVTRGVLLDVAATRGLQQLADEDTVTVDDLVAAERLARTEVRSGDAVFVRVGGGLRVSEQHQIDNRVGLAPECAVWLHEKEVSVFGSDCPEKLPSGYEPKYNIPFHQIVMVRMGLALIDNVATEPLMQACNEEQRYDFMLTVSPLRVPGATGSAVNPLAVF